MPDALVSAQNASTPANEKWPVSSLEYILEACDPSEALMPDDKRYVDLSKPRHGIGIARFERAFRLRAPRNGFHHGLLCGHRGSGKSTELLALRQWADANGFLTVWGQVDAHFGMIDLDYSDIFLLAATMAEQAMRDFGHPLPTEKIRPVIAWFKEVIHEDSEEYKSEIGAEVGGQLGGKLPLGLGSLFAKLTAGFKGTSAHSARIQDTLRRYPEFLIELTADLLTTANDILQAQGKPKGLLLLFDNMDRYDPAQIDKMLVRSSQQILGMACHAVFTFPISLLFNPISGRVTTGYKQCVTLPMIALQSSTDAWKATVEASRFDEQVIATLRALLAKRIDLATLFARPRDVDYLIKMSGGVILDLIQLVASAATYTEDERQITSEATRQAVQELQGTYMRLMATHPKDYRCLAKIARREPISTDADDFSEELNRLLFRGCLLEYVQDEQPWFDVHPTLIETEEFRHAHAACG
jgi:hypothetical protein